MHIEPNSTSPVRFVRRFDPTFCHGLEVMPYLYVFSGDCQTASIISQDEAPRLLDLKLSQRRRKLPEFTWVGRNCDPYPIKERYRRLTRRLIEVLAKHGYPLLIITRSPLILRDIDLIRELNETSGVTVAIMVSSLKWKTHRSLESGTPLEAVQPLAGRRLKTLDRLRRSGIQTGIAFTTPVQDLEDARGEMKHLFRTAQKLNLDFVLFTEASGLALPVQKPKPKVPDPLNHNKRQIQELILELSHLYKIPLRMKRHFPQDWRRENYWLASQIADRAYHQWLEGRAYHRHLRIAGRINRLDVDIRNVIRHGDLHSRLKTDADLKPELEELISGGWCSGERSGVRLR